jgi:leucyl/phenylalanyl-tRNA--protein transferase
VVVRLTRELVFPHPSRASREGVVAVGGDLSPERLILAYSQGIFPWPSEGMPLLWFSPDPRFVLPLDAVHVPRSLRKRMRRGDLEVRADTAFDRVIRACRATPRPGQDGTWITRDIVEGYERLHASGLAHSIECFDGEGQLVGGLYGVSLGAAFFGESMFADAPDASKVAFATLLANARAWGFHFVDCQVPTEHLERFGALSVPRSVFLGMLEEALASETRVGPWTMTITPKEAADLLAERP